jgi:hypothetical protein
MTVSLHNLYFNFFITFYGGRSYEKAKILSYVIPAVQAVVFSAKRA